MKITLKLTLIGFLCLFQFAYAISQDCGCDFTIAPEGGRQTYEPDDLPGFGPGYVICIEGGIYDGFRFIDIVGSEENPIIIKNCGGKVTVNGSDEVGEEVNYTTIQFESSQYVHVTGNGDEDDSYGIFVESTRLNEDGKSGLSGLSVGSLSSDFEIDHIEIQKAGFAGIIAKTDPKTTNCESEETQASFRDNFTLRNLDIHHNYIHNTGGEGMYIGATWGYSETSSKDVCSGYAHMLENIEIHHNIIEQAGWDAMQISLAHEGTKIYNNEIYGYGYYAAQEGETNQCYGIALGSGTRADVYNNIIIQDEKNAIEIQRGISGINVLTGTKIFNNVIYGPGEYGIWFHIRHVENEIITDLEEDRGFHFINNTIVSPGLDNDTGLGIYMSTCQPSNEGDAGCRYNFDLNFINNIVVDPALKLGNGTPGWMKTSDMYIQLVTVELRDSENTHVENNLYVRTNIEESTEEKGVVSLDEVEFRGPSGYLYAIRTENSAAVDAGMDVSEYGITTDLTGGERPFGEGYDIGAYEFGASLISSTKTLEENTDLISTLYPNPTDGIITFDLNKNAGTKFDVEIYTIAGGKLYSKSFKKSIEHSSIDLNKVANLHSQIVIMMVKTKEDYQTVRIRIK